MASKALEIIHRNVMLPKLTQEMFDQLVEPAIEKIIKDSNNKFDDMLLAVIPLLQEQMHELIVEMWDSLIKEDEPSGPGNSGGKGKKDEGDLV